MRFPARAPGKLRPGSFFLWLSIALSLCGCSYRMPRPDSGAALKINKPVTLYRHPLEIRMSRPRHNFDRDFLILYATGDGGWRGLDEELFERIAEWKYAVIGFSSKSYLKNLGYVSDTTTPRRLVRDFKRIIAFGEQELGLRPDSRIVLVGLSRGAGLSVVAAGQGDLSSSLAGLLAIALTKEEEHVVRYRIRRGAPEAQLPKRETVEIKTYDYLPRPAAFPVTVIQSSNDGYLPARAARELFGPDTPMRKLVPIPARNHGFGGGRDVLFRQAQESLLWFRNLLVHAS